MKFLIFLFSPIFLFSQAKMYCYTSDATGIHFVTCPVPTVCTTPTGYTSDAKDSAGNPIFPPNSLGTPIGNGLYTPVVVLNSTAPNAQVAANAVASKDSLGMPSFAYYNMVNTPIWISLTPLQGTASKP